MLDTARTIMEKAKARGVKLYLPVDCVVAQSAAADAVAMHVPVQEIPKEWMALDIGPASTTLFGEALADAKTIVWNGPMGMFELDPFSRGTYGLVTSSRPPTPSPSWAAATPTRPCTRLVRRTGFPTYPPEAARSSSFWKGRPCPRWRPSRPAEDNDEKVDARRQLEDA